MSVDWSQFRDGDRVRVIFEGDWRSDVLWYDDGCQASRQGRLRHATSAELIERPFTPPAAGKLFRNGDCLYMSWGATFVCIRLDDGNPYSALVGNGERWSAMAPEWLASIEVLDV